LLFPALKRVVSPVVTVYGFRGSAFTETLNCWFVSRVQRFRVQG